MARLTLPIASLLTLLVVAPAQAASAKIGSDLSAPASIAVSNPNDWSAWSTALASGRVFQSPVQGEVNVVRFKGRINPSTATDRQPDVVLLAQVLRPQPDGSVKVPLGGTSRPLPLPFGGDPQRISTYTRSDIDRPDGPDGKGGSRLCIQKGDYIAIATNGGFGDTLNGFPHGSYPNGAELQMFGRVAGSATDAYFPGFGTGNADGRQFTGTRAVATELLMQATIGTGTDARFTCQTAEEQRGAAGPPAPGTDPDADGEASIPDASRSRRIRRKVVRIGVRCDGPKPCAGRVTLTNRSTKYGSARFGLAAGARTSLPIKINKACKRQLKKGRGKVTVNATAETRAGKSTRRFVIKRA